MTGTPPRSDVTEAQLAAIDRMHGRCTASGIEYWLFGGWAVDFHAGRVTRAHSDIDLAVWRDDVETVSGLLEADGWRRGPDEVDGVRTYQRGVVRAEVALLARDEDGTIYTPLEDGRGAWPRRCFGDDVGQLEDIRARVIGRDALVEEKSAGYGGWEAKAKDRIDVAVLTQLDPSA